MTDVGSPGADERGDEDARNQPDQRGRQPMTAAREQLPGGPGDITRVDVMLAIVDFPMLSAAFRKVIDAERDMDVVVEATKREAVLSQARSASPDVIILEYEAVATAGAVTTRAIDEVHAA